MTPSTCPTAIRSSSPTNVLRSTPLAAAGRSTVAHAGHDLDQPVPFGYFPPDLDQPLPDQNRHFSDAQFRQHNFNGLPAHVQLIRD